MMPVSPLHGLEDPASRRVGGRRLRVVVAGEFKSGKSSVVNALLRQPVLPMQSRPASRPAFLVRHAPEQAGTALLHHGDGATEPAGRLDDTTDFGGAGLCEVFVDAPHLDGVELVELPFPCDGAVGAEALALMSGADLLIWVSIASQAWRLSEKSILSQLPPMRARSVIVLSRADKLRSAGDWDRVEERVQREAGPFFAAVAFVQASRETIRQSADDAHAWDASGGRILSDLIAEHRRRMARGGDREAPAAGAPQAAPPSPPVAPEKQEEMEHVAAALAGLACGGIVQADSGLCLAAFGPERERAGRLAPAVRDALAGRVALEAATGASVEGITLRLGSQLMLVSRQPDGQGLAFLLMRNDRTNIALVEAALRRICGIWCEP